MQLHKSILIKKHPLEVNIYRTISSKKCTRRFWIEYYRPSASRVACHQNLRVAPPRSRTRMKFHRANWYYRTSASRFAFRQNLQVAHSRSGRVKFHRVDWVLSVGSFLFFLPSIVASCALSQRAGEVSSWRLSIIGRALLILSVVKTCKFRPLAADRWYSIVRIEYYRPSASCFACRQKTESGAERICPSPGCCLILLNLCVIKIFIYFYRWGIYKMRILLRWP